MKREGGPPLDPRRRADEEIHHHIDEKVDYLVTVGWEEGAARREARRRFGNVSRFRREMTEGLGDRDFLRGLASTGADLRFALRAVRRAPAMFAAAALSLGIGVAAVTCVWASADQLLRPLPFDPEEELAWVGTSIAGLGRASSPSSAPDFLELREGLRSMDLAAFRDGGINLGDAPAEWVASRRVSAGFFDLVGVPPVIGRGIAVEDEAAEAADVAVMAHGLWERRFGSDPDVLGSSILVDGAPVTVVGVMPAGYSLARGRPEVWLPLRVSATDPREARAVHIVARVRDDDLAAARAELATMTSALAEAYPATNADRVFLVADLMDELYRGGSFRQGLLAALVATVLVLLIACANVGNLLLARGATRRDEIGLRRALGGGRWRISRLLFVEALVLATMGAVVALTLSAFGVRGMAALMPSDLPRADDLTIGVRVALMALAVSWGSALLFALVPTLTTMRRAGRLQGDLSAGRGTSRAGRGRLRSTLVSAEVGLALVLLMMTSLVLRSVSNIRSVDTGFDLDGVLGFGLSLPAGVYSDAELLRNVASRVRGELEAMPGVDAVGLGVGLPGEEWRSLNYRLPGNQADSIAGRGPSSVVVRFADHGWLPSLGAELVRGRGFLEGDDARSSDVTLVSSRFAERLWPGVDPVGRTLVLGGRTVEVVGVVSDLMELGPTVPPTEAAYLPLAQWPSLTLSVVLRGDGPVTSMVGAVRERIARVDPSVALHGVTRLDDAIMAPAERFVVLATFLSVLAGAALVLAVVGVFGSMAYSATQRVPEIGVYLALGASPKRVGWMMLRHAFVVSSIGVVGGVALALPASRVLRSFLFEVSPADPRTLAAATALLLLVSLAAAWVPARRASAVDPMRSLRSKG